MKIKTDVKAGGERCITVSIPLQRPHRINRRVKQTGR